MKNLPFTFPKEPSIAGFIVLSYVIGSATTSGINPYRALILAIAYLHLILTIDFFFYIPSLKRPKSLYALVSNGLIFLLLSLWGGYQSFLGLIPVAILTVSTIFSLRIFGRRNAVTLSLGTAMLTTLTIYTSAFIGNLSLETLEATLLYTIYSVGSVLYVEAKVGRIGDSTPLIFIIPITIYLYLQSPYYPLVTVDLLAKSLTHFIRRDYIDVKDIVGLGKKEFIRMILHTPLIIAASLL